MTILGSFLDVIDDIILERGQKLIEFALFYTTVPTLHFLDSLIFAKGKRLSIYGSGNR